MINIILLLFMNKVIKKKPGRPKSIKKQSAMRRKGIIKTPSNSEHFLEFYYDNPLIFKKILYLFKTLSSEKINFIFDKEHISITTLGHFKKNKILITIDCHKVNHYYVKKKIEFCLTRNYLSSIFTNINKSHKSITILSKTSTKNSLIYILLDGDLNIRDEHKIQLTEFSNIPINIKNFMYDDYEIYFKLPGREFKKMISDIKLFTNIVTLYKTSNNDEDKLTIEYVGNNKQTTSNKYFLNSQAIFLKTKIKDDKSFRVSFEIDNIKPISSSFLTEEIEIFSKEGMPLLIKILMFDKAFDIRILSNIISMQI